jgi:twitching motility protein PilT
VSNLDSLLQFMQRSQADELRLGTDQKPRMLAGGAPLRLTMAATDNQTLRFLLSGILTPEREQVVRERGTFECEHNAGEYGTFRIRMQAAGERGVEITLRRETGAFDASETHEPDRAEPRQVHRSELSDTRVHTRVQSAAKERAPEVKMDGAAALTALLRTAADLRASDVHLGSGEPPRVRIDGILKTISEFGDELEIEAIFQLDEAALQKIRGGVSVEFNIAALAEGSARVHIYQTLEGIAAAIRLLPARAPSLKSLSLPTSLDDLIGFPHGLLLVCGASGSGKSTTLAALAQSALDRRSIVLITLEDPIEYALVPGRASLVRRRQVGRDVPSFGQGLRDALRENPDLLLVGELRDSESIQMAMTAAETGHLVLATLHARSAASAITRLIDAYPPGQQEQARRQLAESLRAIVAQRLVPRARHDGRIPALEVLRVNQATANLIREGKTPQLVTVMQSARNEGMLLLERCLAEQVRDGLITLDAARAAANDPSSLSLQL